MLLAIRKCPSEKLRPFDVELMKEVIKKSSGYYLSVQLVWFIQLSFHLFHVGTSEKKSEKVLILHVKLAKDSNWLIYYSQIQKDVAVRRNKKFVKIKFIVFHIW